MLEQEQAHNPLEQNHLNPEPQLQEPIKPEEEPPPYSRREVIAIRAVTSTGETVFIKAFRG